MEYVKEETQKPMIYEKPISTGGQFKITNYYKIEGFVLRRKEKGTQKYEEIKKRILNKMKEDPESIPITIIEDDEKTVHEYWISGGILFNSRFCCRFLKRADSEDYFFPEVPYIRIQNPQTGLFETKSKIPDGEEPLTQYPGSINLLE